MAETVQLDQKPRLSLGKRQARGPSQVLGCLQLNIGSVMTTSHAIPSESVATADVESAAAAAQRADDERSASAIVCQICAKSLDCLGLAEREHHVNACLDGLARDGAAALAAAAAPPRRIECPMCAKEIGAMSDDAQLRHVTACMDAAEPCAADGNECDDAFQRPTAGPPRPKPSARAPSAAPADELRCQLCGLNMLLLTVGQRHVHMNACLGRSERDESAAARAAKRARTKLGARPTAAECATESAGAHGACVLCGMALANANAKQRISHIRTCAKASGMSLPDLNALFAARARAALGGAGGAHAALAAASRLAGGAAGGTTAALAAGGACAGAAAAALGSGGAGGAELRPAPPASLEAAVCAAFKPNARARRRARCAGDGDGADDGADGRMAEITEGAEEADGVAHVPLWQRAAGAHRGDAASNEAHAARAGATAGACAYALGLRRGARACGGDTEVPPAAQRCSSGGAGSRSGGEADLACGGDAPPSHAAPTRAGSPVHARAHARAHLADTDADADADADAVAEDDDDDEDFEDELLLRAMTQDDEITQLLLERHLAAAAPPPSRERSVEPAAATPYEVAPPCDCSGSRPAACALALSGGPAPVAPAAPPHLSEPDPSLPDPSLPDPSLPDPSLPDFGAVAEWACADVAAALCFALRHSAELPADEARARAPQPRLCDLSARGLLEAFELALDLLDGGRRPSELFAFWRCAVPRGLRQLLESAATADGTRGCAIELEPESDNNAGRGAWSVPDATRAALRARIVAMRQLYARALALCGYSFVDKQGELSPVMS
jgi:hypothetical protein